MIRLKSRGKDRIPYFWALKKYSKLFNKLLKTTVGSKFQAFRSRLAFKNVSNKTKTVLVTLIALNTRNLSKALML